MLILMVSRLSSSLLAFSSFLILVTELLGSHQVSREKQRLVIVAENVTYECVRRSGQGSFGVVYMAVTSGTGEVVAIKRVLQDPRYKVRSAYPSGLPSIRRSCPAWLAIGPHLLLLFHIFYIAMDDALHFLIIPAPSCLSYLHV